MGSSARGRSISQSWSRKLCEILRNLAANKAACEFQCED